jgi:type I restriction enzyme R subunit
MVAEGGGGQAEEPLDFLSEIVRKLNEIYGAELTEEHRLDLSNVRTRVQGDEGLRNVMTGDNSETNKRRKFEEVIGSIFLSYVNDRVDFYQKFENPVIRNLIVDEFWRDYRKRVNY